ncbi:Reticulocyte-binding protein 2 homolog a [Durusdinium trenchii]|uniref:Reticulocyte-binding protein 2 homolog a n=1 Tax=Durusdinium trenchii TaxID=1381693 RepID=A0ABP0J1Q4_9DINO
MEQAVERAARCAAALERLDVVQRAQRDAARLSKHKQHWQQEQLRLNAQAAATEAQMRRAWQGAAAARGQPGGDEKSACGHPRRGKRRQRPAAGRRQAAGTSKGEEDKDGQGGFGAAQRAAASRAWRLRAAKEGVDGFEDEEQARLPESEEDQVEALQADLALQRERLFRQEMAQVKGMGEVVKALRLGSMAPEDVGALLGEVRQQLNVAQEQLHTELLEAMDDVSKARGEVALALKEQNSGQEQDQPGDALISEEQKDAMLASLQHLLEGYESCTGVLAAVDAAQDRLKRIVDTHNARLAENDRDRKAYKQIRAKRVATETWIGDDAHDCIVKLYREIVLRGRGLGLFHDRVDLELPGLLRARVEEHVEYVEEGRRLARVRKDLVASRNRELVRARNKGLDEVAAAIRLADEDRARRGQAAEHAEVRAEIHRRLEAQQEEMRKREQVLEAEREEQKLRAQEEQERREEIEALERERKHAIVAELNRKRAFDLAIQQLTEEQNTAELEAIKDERAPINRERTVFREQARLVRLEQDRWHAEQERLRAAIAEQKLAKLRTTVPYFGKLQEILPSRERLEQQTFSSSVVPDAAYKNFSKEGLFKKTGFSDAEVCGDVRFKVVQALRSQGLHQSAYAQTLLRSMNQQTMVSKNLHSSS